LTTSEPGPIVLFVNGFHRSGTTLATTAATVAAGGVTLTVGHLARRIPSLDRFLGAPHEVPPDRGVDRLPVTESTAEEYGWLLYHATGRRYFRNEDAGILRDVVSELAAESGASVVVLKNPWDTGRERLLLDQLPTARVLLVRRAVADIEDSSRRALLRFLESDGYLRALMADDAGVRKLLAALANPWQRRLMLFAARWSLRIGAIRLARSAVRLPPDRVAYVCYEELRDDPATAAGWAAHLLDPAAFARAYTELVFPDCGPARRGGWTTRAIDAYWARAWRRARAAQVRRRVADDPVPIAGNVH
jgi:hypothetical protein